MEFEKHEKGSLLDKNVEDKQTVSCGDSEAKPLIFTFVPTVRRLPTHTQLADTSKFLVKIPEEPSDKNPETVNRSDSSDYSVLNTWSQQEREHETLTNTSEVSGKSSQERGLEARESEGMQQSDLFKAEYVFIVDSEGEDEAASRKDEQSHLVSTGTTAARPKTLAITSNLGSDTVRPKTRGTDPKFSSYSEMAHGLGPQQRPAQLTSSPTTSEQLACTPPAFSFVSPTNQRTPPDPLNLDGASVLEEFHTRRLDVSGALVEETATYFQSTSHSSDFSASKGTSSTLPFPHSTQLSGSYVSSPTAAHQEPGLMSEVLKKSAASASHARSPRESPRAPSPATSCGASLKPHSALYIPVRIVTHSLSPSPKQFTTSFHGSSSTLCSQMSSSGNLSRSGVKSPVPSRLSLLTAILKSNPSHRPSSPASCPTFSLNSLASSTLTLDQKAKQTPPMPKKSLSSCSLRSGSPDQGSHPVSELTQQSFPLPFPSRTLPVSQQSSLSPTSLVSSSPFSLNAEKATSLTSSKTNTKPSLPQTYTPSFAGLPPVPLSSSLYSAKGKQNDVLKSPEKPKNIYSCSSTLPSSLRSSVSPPVNQSATLPMPEKCFLPSSTLSNLITRSKGTSSQLSGHEPNISASASPLFSSASSVSLPNLGFSPTLPTHLPTQTFQLSPSALHPTCDSDTLPSRLGKRESTIPSHRSPVSAPSPPISVTRTKELMPPCTLPMATGPENKKPKQYKIKSSYKAFAAIPTNTLLLEQKALDEPAKTESVSKDSPLDPPVELCLPAQLRQQTEELCATIDKVLQDSLSMHSSDSPSRSPQTWLGSNAIKTSTTLPRAAGRETKYANLSSPSSTVSDSQLTKPGVIRPVPVKSKILLKKEEEMYEPNPFSKYLEDNTDLSEQDVTVTHKPISLHPLYQTKLYPPAKSLLHPETLSPAECLTPGPFSHVSSFSLTEEQESSSTLLSHSAFHKLSHPMVAIPEHESLDSKEQ
ncbi:muscular LMNA-interacting protein [Ochotona princeps]|uniref:muscular LMNA-interacting protein n=1 Tax=Ochotona princeps TaxID=9978 RepID=UPI002715485F|nr:muscular LMNA-interacting protein [Ochotona princeps]